MKDVAHCQMRLATVPLSQVDLLAQRTFVKPVHVQLTDKGRYIGVFEVLAGGILATKMTPIKG